MKVVQSVPEPLQIEFRHQEITQRNEYNKYLFVYGSSSGDLWYMKDLVLPQDQFPSVSIPLSG
jgi:hypothetical protein